MWRPEGSARRLPLAHPSPAPQAPPTATPGQQPRTWKEGAKPPSSPTLTASTPYFFLMMLFRWWYTSLPSCSSGKERRKTGRGEHTHCRPHTTTERQHPPSRAPTVGTRGQRHTNAVRTICQRPLDRHGAPQPSNHFTTRNQQKGAAPTTPAQGGSTHPPTHPHGLGKGGGAGGHDHELLEGKLVARVHAAVDDVEGGHRQHNLGVARQVSNVAVQGHALLGRAGLRSGRRGEQAGRQRSRT